MKKITTNKMLSQAYDSLSKRGELDTSIPSYIINNLNPRFKLRSYQIEAIARLIHYIERGSTKKRPTHLLFNMATGSGKTLLMAANMLYFYNKGYRNFLFFVNSTNIIEKTRDNFLNPLSSKYLFNDVIKFGVKEVQVREVSNFDQSNAEDINIVFITIQGLHSQLNLLKENAITFEDFRDNKIVIISDEAHHINAWTRKALNKNEERLKKTWEYTVMQILHSNEENIMIEYTATIDLNNPLIFDKYKDKIIFQYTLKQFRAEGYSKEIKVLQADLDNWKRMLQAIILSQYRRKVAEEHKIQLKPVVLFKSKNIKESKENYALFLRRLALLDINEINHIRVNSQGTVIEKAFDYFEKLGVTDENLITELQEEFSAERCILLDSKNIDREKQLKLNSLEDENNEIRAVFEVKMLDEGWDVLNLFDIVRLYNTRDGRWTKKGKYFPGSTTISEQQLIGRGARYYPFIISGYNEPYERKFDNNQANELKVLEELYYHSQYNPKYILELTHALRDYGLPIDEKEIKIKRTQKSMLKGLKDKSKVERVLTGKTRNRLIKTINDIPISRRYYYSIYTGVVQENALLRIQRTMNNNSETLTAFKIKNLGNNIIRKAMARIDFYRFNNLKRYFPLLASSTEFIESLKDISIVITNTNEKIEKFSPETKLRICESILIQLQKQICNQLQK